MLNFVEQRLQQVQVCFNCLVKIDTEYSIMKGDGSTCTSASCLDCLDSNLVCNLCSAKGHENVEPLLRACDSCSENKAGADPDWIPWVLEHSEISHQFFFH